MSEDSLFKNHHAKSSHEGVIFKRAIVKILQNSTKTFRITEAGAQRRSV